MGSAESKQEGQIQDSRYGKATLITKKNQQCALRKVFISDDSQHEQFLKRAKVDHPNLVKILESGINKEKELCSTFEIMFVVSEYFPTNLHREIANRKIKGAFWSEEQLWNQALGLIDLLATMQEAGIVHQNIRPLTISYVNENTLKLCDNYFQQSAFQMALQNPENQKLFELSPKLLEAINLNNQFPRHNLYKSDVWSLGMCMLEACLLDHCRNCFEYLEQLTSFESGHTDVSRKVAQLKNNSKLHQLITQMLTIDEDLRPDFKQLRALTITKSLETSLTYCDTKPPQPLIEDHPDELQILSDQNYSSISKLLKEEDQQLRGKPKIIVKKPKKKELGIYKYQEQMIIKDTSKSQIQQTKLVDYSFNKQFANSSLQFTNSSKNPDKEKIDQLVGIKSYSIGPTITPISQTTKYTSSISQPQTQLTNIITIDPHPSCSSIPLSFTEIPLTLTFQKDTKFQEEMQSIIEMNQSRVFKNETYQDGSSYMGETYKGLRDGFGKYQFADGGYYEGQWKQNKMHGYGTLFYGVGKKAYEGQFDSDQFSGFGTLYNKDPSKLNQTFDCSNFDLIGNCWIKYVGNFQNDLKNGQGVLHLSNGESYRGEFHEDYVDGHGQFQDKAGIWRRNRLVQ